MTFTDTFNASNRNLRDSVSGNAPASVFAALVSGFRAYRVHAALEAKSDAELSALGLARADLPRVAFDTVADRT